MAESDWVGTVEVTFELRLDTPVGLHRIRTSSSFEPGTAALLWWPDVAGIAYAAE